MNSSKGSSEPASVNSAMILSMPGLSSQTLRLSPSPYRSMITNFTEHLLYHRLHVARGVAVHRVKNNLRFGAVHRQFVSHVNGFAHRVGFHLNRVADRPIPLHGVFHTAPPVR